MDCTINLRKRGDKTILVKKAGAQIDPEGESNYVRVEMMHPSIAKYRSLYADDLSQCLGLNETRLKPELTFSVLLNALHGLQKRIVGAGLLTATQYSRAESGKFACLHVSSSAIAISFFSKKFVLFAMSWLLSRKCKIMLMPSTHYSVWIVMKEIAMTVVALMGILLKRPTLTIRAEEEFNTFESFKRNKYRPKWVRAKSEILSGIGLNGNMEEIIVGPVEENGKDLPLGENLGDYVNEKDRMDVLKFFEEHKKCFTTLWIKVQCEAKRRVVEVGCERFFWSFWLHLITQTFETGCEDI